MPEITYKSIKSLLTQEEQRGRSVYCTFKCPVSGTEISSSATLERGAGKEMADRAKLSVTRNLFSSARSTIYQTISKALGNNLLGRMGRDLTSSAMSQVSRGSSAPSFSTAEKRNAVVAAFHKVTNRFTWDQNNKRWIATQVAKETLSEFDQQLQAAPLEKTYDHSILARMLAEISNADGRIRKDEREFLNDFIPTSVVGSVNELLKKPPLSKIELEETTAGKTRETMLMVAWTLALTDEELAQEELERLSSYTEGLQINAPRATEIKQHAQMFIFDQILAEVYAQGKLNPQRRQQALDLASNLGLTADEAERADVRYRKRQGIL